MIASILFSAGCKSNQEKSNESVSSSKELEKVVKAPEMDLHTAVFLENMEAINQHILAESDLNIAEPSVGSSPLISAAAFGKTKAAKALIEGGANVNFQNNDGSTALHSSAFLCRTDIVKLLLSNGADKEIKNNVGSTALATVAGKFSDVKAIYDIFSKELGPLGLKFDYEQIQKTRPQIAALLN